MEHRYGFPFSDLENSEMSSNGESPKFDKMTAASVCHLIGPEPLFHKGCFGDFETRVSDDKL